MIVWGPDRYDEFAEPPEVVGYCATCWTPLRPLHYDVTSCTRCGREIETRDDWITTATMERFRREAAQAWRDAEADGLIRGCQVPRT